MKPLHTLLAFVILSSLFMSELHAGTVFEYSFGGGSKTFSLNQAVWRKYKDLLVIKGRGAPGTKVDAFIEGTDVHLGSKTVNKRGYWKLKFYDLTAVPCGIRAENGELELEKAVYKAPADCVSSDDTAPPENTPPKISGSPDTQAAEGQAYRFTPSANDADGDNLSFSITNKPSWAKFDTSTGALSGTPGYNSAGTTSNIRISVSDGKATASLNAFSITVSGTNRAPTISGAPGTSVAEGQAYRFTPSANDADGDDLTFSIANKPSWANFDASTGTLRGTPGYDSAGTTSNIRIRVSDGSETASLSAFNITVGNTNRAPTISGTPSTNVEEGTAYRFTPTASDPDGDALTYSINGLPNWASFDNQTGTLSGAPDSNSAGTYPNIVISVSDGSSTASLGGFAITVADVSQGGTFQFSKDSYTVDEGSVLTLTITRSNPEGSATVSCGTDGQEAKHDADYYGFNPVPVTFQNGERSKTITVPTIADDVSDPDETLHVYLSSPSDGYTLETPNLVVATIRELTAPNSAPTISGTAPSSVSAGDEYRFAPTATDADDDPLSFSVANLPSWASFSDQTGAINGTPSSEDAGLYEDIVITVTDGTASTSLNPLSIAVTDTDPNSVTGSVSLAWVAPTTRTDGSALDMSEIGGYKIYMGTTADNLAQVMDLADSTINDHVVDELVTRDYYFAVTTYDSDGVESSYSNIVMKSAM